MSRYAIEVIGLPGAADLNYRVTDTSTDTRVATCYVKENAEMVCAALNAYARRQEPGVIVAVSGGRDYSDDAKLNAVLSALHKERRIELLIEGACPVGDGGADERSRKWAKRNEVNSLSVPAKSKRFGWPACGPLRNEEIGSLRPDIWVLFPGGKGTASARKCAVACGAELLEVTYD